MKQRQPPSERRNWLALADWPGLPYLARRLKDLPDNTPVAVYPWIPADAESSGLVPGYLIAASDLNLPVVDLPGDDEPTSPPPPPPPPPPEPVTEIWFVGVEPKERLLLRKQAGRNGEIVDRLPRGMRLTIRGRILADNMTWTEVVEPVKGYVAMDWLLLAPPDAPPAPPPPPPLETWFVAEDGLRVRFEPKTGVDNIIALLSRGNELRSKRRLTASGREWVELAEPLSGYVALEYLLTSPPVPLPAPQPPGLPAPPPPTKPLPHPSCVIGLHISPNVDGGPGVVLEHLERRARAGRPAAGVLLMDPGYGVQVEIDDIRRVSPETEIVSRRSAGDYERDWTNATAQEGRDFASAHYLKWIASKPSVLEADFHQFFNEPKPLPTLAALNGFNLWLHGILDRAGELRIKIALPVFSTGFGRLREFNDVAPFYWELGSTHEVIDRIIREKHRMGIHAYKDKTKGNERWDDPWELFRHEAIYRVLPPDRRPDLAILEHGDEKLKHKGVDTFESNIVYTIQRMQQSPKVRYAALWGVGETSDQWREDRIEVFIPKLTEICLR
jgi:hypothetical protein